MTEIQGKSILVRVSKGSSYRSWLQLKCLTMHALKTFSWDFKGKGLIVNIMNIKTEIQYRAKVMQTNFDEFPGFSGLFNENSLEMKFRRYFGAFSRHLLFQPREFSLRVVLRQEFSCDNSQRIFERNFIHCCPQVFEKSLPWVKYARLLSVVRACRSTVPLNSPGYSWATL